MGFTKYNHNIQEKKIYDFWEKNNLFGPSPTKTKKTFSIVIPPPNITGKLHMGHALNNSLQDVLIRYYRMNGFETLWQTCSKSLKRGCVKINLLMDNF